MTRTTLGLIIFNILLTSFAQIALKAGMNSSRMAVDPTGGIRLIDLVAIVTNPMVLLGLAIYFSSALLWLIVLARVDVSIAYPFVGLGFIVTMLLAWMIHGEALTAAKVTGTAMIVLGVVVLARG
jgi:multidrug transporter EmrE-like cation transporter